MKLRTYWATLPTLVQVLTVVIAIAIVFDAVLGVLVVRMYANQVPSVVSYSLEPMSWRMDPYIPIRVNTEDFSYEIGKITKTGPVSTIVTDTITWPTVESADPIGVTLFAVLVKHDSTDLPNHVEDYVVEEMLVTDPRVELLHVVKTGNATWTSTQAVEATRSRAEKRAKDLAQKELELQGRLSVDISSFNYDSVNILINGVQLARVDAGYSRPILHLPAACLKGDAAAKANYVMVFGNDFGYVAVAKSLDGFRGTIPSDIQLCWIKGQASALKALDQVAAEFTGMARGNWVVWHEGTKAMVSHAEFRSPPAAYNRNQ